MRASKRESTLYGSQANAAAFLATLDGQLYPPEARRLLVDSETLRAKYYEYARHRKAWTNGVSCKHDCPFCRSIAGKARNEELATVHMVNADLWDE
jgi:hypothetical protein